MYAQPKQTSAKAAYNSAVTNREKLSLAPDTRDLAHNRAETHTVGNEKLVTTALIFFLALHASLIALDFWSHPDQGVANLERRKFLVETFSPFFKHIGNYGITAILVMTAGLTKQLVDSVSQNKITKAMVKKGYMWAIAGTLTLNGLIETFAHNNEMYNDLAVAAWSVTNSVIVVALIQKYLANRKARYYTT